MYNIDSKSFLFILAIVFILGATSGSVLTDLYLYNQNSEKIFTKEDVEYRKMIACSWGVAMVGISISSNDPKDKFKGEMCDFVNRNPYEEFKGD